MAKVRLSDPTIRKYKPVPGKVREIPASYSTRTATSSKWHQMILNASFRMAAAFACR